MFGFLKDSVKAEVAEYDVDELLRMNVEEGTMSRRGANARQRLMKEFGYSALQLSQLRSAGSNPEAVAEAVADLESGIDVMIEVEDGVKSGVGSAVVGGLLLGPLGAVVGGMHSRGKVKVRKVQGTIRTAVKGIVVAGTGFPEVRIPYEELTGVDVSRNGNLVIDHVAGDSLTMMVMTFSGTRRSAIIQAIRDRIPEPEVDPADDGW